MSSVIRSIVGLLLLGLMALGLAQDSDVKPFVPNNRWALVIGVSGYSEEIGTLRYTAKEAREVSETLTGDLAFAPENVRLLADGGQSPVAPTSANILGALDALLSNKSLDKANLFVFYFSGHGVATPSGDYLLPADIKKGEYETKGVPVREVIRRIVGAGLKNVLFIADACRAGTANDFGEDLTELCHRANLAVILGCAPGKRSYEYDEFQRGAFTNFLLAALKRPELRDASGALWASRLGADVRTRTHDFTEPDKGERNAQTPTLWAEQSTLDVLLAAYPQPPVSDEAVRQFRDKAAKLGKEDYAAAMVAYAYALFEKDRTDETVELLKTVDALGELTPQARVILAVALDGLGRTGEAQRVFRTFVPMPDSVWRDIALSASTARDLDPTLRVASALRLYETGGSWATRSLGVAIVDNWGSYEQKLKTAKRFAVEGGDTARHRHYADGRLATLEGRWADATKAFDAALASPGDTPSQVTLFIEGTAPYRARGDRKALRAYLDRGVRWAPGRALLERAQLAKDEGDAAERVADLKAALAADLSPTLLLRAASIAGPYIGMAMDEFKAAAAKHPYSWRARMVGYLVNEIRGDKKAMETEGYATDRYMDDRLTVYSTLFAFMDDFMTESVLLGKFDPTLYRTQLDFYFLMMRDYSESFGLDAELWMQMAKYGMYNERGEQVQRIVAKRLPYAPASAPKSLKPMLFLLAINRGDAAAAGALYGGSFEPTERTDPRWVYACYQATLGNAKEAARLIAGLAPPSPEIAAPMEALKTYLLAAGGDLAGARKRLKDGPARPVTGAFEGLTWALLGDWKRAEPLLAEQAIHVNWAFLFVQEYAVRRLDARYRATGRLAQARELASMASISQPGNPLYARYAYVASPGVAQFAGVTSLKGGTLDDKDPNLEGVVSWSVSPSGALTGSFRPAKGEAAALRGKVDASGNVRGSGAWHGKRYGLTGKIAPPALYKSLASFHTKGQVLQMVDEEGRRVFLVGRT